MNRKTCASVAAKTPAGMASGMARALASSDYAELRLDYLRPSDVPRALELCRKKISKAVCTLRPRSEGGMFSGTEAERISVLKMIAEYGPRMIDIEYSALKRGASLARYVKRTGTPILVSWHDFSGTPPAGALRARLRAMQRHGQCCKIVTTAKRDADAAAVLSLYGSASGACLVAFAMGEAGRMSRLLCLYMGSPFTYVSLGRPVAPGQFSAAQMARMLGRR